MVASGGCKDGAWQQWGWAIKEVRDNVWVQQR
jgi:hypothetical protein